MANPGVEPNFYIYLLSIGASVIGILIAALAYLGRGFAQHLDSCIDTLFKKIDSLNTERGRRWEEQEKFCRICYALLNRIGGIIEGRRKD